MVPLLVATTLIWGSAFTAIKKAVAVLSPLDLAVLRFVLSSLLFAGLLLTLTRRGARFPRYTPVQWAWLALAGFLGVAAYHVSLNTGEDLLTRTSSEDVAAILAAFLIALVPLFTLLLAPLFVRERFNPRRLGGILVALVGTGFLVFWGRGVPIEPDALAGALVVLAAPLSWALYTLTIKRHFQGEDPLVLTSWAMICGTLFLVPLASDHFVADLGKLGPELWAWVLLLSAGATVFGNWAWNYALSHWEASRVGTFAYLVPLFGLLVARTQAGERITWQILVGGGLVLAGLWWANAVGSRPPRPSAATPRAGPPPRPRKRAPAPPRPGP